MGSGINSIASPLLITELAHPNQRGKVTACYNVFYYFGSTIAAWTTFGTLQIHGNWSWRLPSLLQVAPSAIQLALIWLLPESPRWLISKDRQEEALHILAKYHANGDVHDDSVKFEFAEIRASIKQDKEISRGRFLDLFSTRKSFHSLSLSHQPNMQRSRESKTPFHLRLLRSLSTTQWHRVNRILSKVSKPTLTPLALN